VTGAWYHGVHADLRAVCNRWEDTAPGVVNQVMTGSKPWTEHYPTIMAKVPDVNDPDTRLNRDFINDRRPADRIYIAGEAGSHCVKASTEHIVEHVGQVNLPKLVLDTDCMSPVSGFEAQYEKFARCMMARGVQSATAADVLPELPGSAHH
jgi:nicotinamidase-related amidase